MSLQLDYDDFVDALQFVEQVTGRSCMESLNRAGLHVIIGTGKRPGAMQLTPKATRASINSVSDGQIRGYVVRRLKSTGQWPQTSARINQLARRERKRRNSAVGYTAYAGWNNAAKQMGGRGAGKGINSNFKRSGAASGGATRATVVNLTATILNTAAYAERIGYPALQGGIDNAAEDLVDYGTKKIQKGFNKVNP